VTVTIELRARSVGTDDLRVSVTAHEQDACADTPCPNDGKASLVAVAPGTGSGAPIANTGSPALGAQLGVGVAALLAGGLLLAVARSGRRRVNSPN
jgi:hypothetical protein